VVYTSTRKKLETAICGAGLTSAIL